MMDLSFLRRALGSAGAGLRRHGGDHALGLLVGGGAALSVIAAGVAFAAFGGHGGGGGGGGGGSGGGAGQSTQPRGAALQSGDSGGGGLPRSRGPVMVGGSEAAVAGLLQGRAPTRAPAWEPQNHGSVPVQDQPNGGQHVGDGSFETRSRPMLAMAGNRFDPIALGVGGGYGGRAKAASSESGSTDTPVVPGNNDTSPNTDPPVTPPSNNLPTDPVVVPITNPPDGGSKTNPLDVTPPIPEPESYALMLAGLGLLGWHARRRKASARRAD